MRFILCTYSRYGYFAYFLLKQYYCSLITSIQVDHFNLSRGFTLRQQIGILQAVSLFNTLG